MPKAQDSLNSDIYLTEACHDADTCRKAVRPLLHGNMTSSCLLFASVAICKELLYGPHGEASGADGAQDPRT